MTKYKSHFIFFALIILFGVIFFFIGEIVLPFILALLLAYVLNPTIRRIQKLIPNRTAAVSIFLVLSVVITTGSVLFLGSHVAHDFKRLNNAFIVFTEENSDEIDHVKAEMKYYIEEFYSKDLAAKQMNGKGANNSTEIDSQTIKNALANIVSFIGSEKEEKSSSNGINWFVMVISALGYFVYIIYSYGYFERKFRKYFGGERMHMGIVGEFVNDFYHAFMIYFRQRSKIVLIACIFFITAFLIIGLPGAIIAGILAGVLCYIPHFHYLAIVPLSLSCWALSIEQDQSFFFYIGLVLGVFILFSILEELILFPRIMKGVSAMNPSIMLISLAVWSYVFGVFGLIIGLPLTTVLLIYLDRILLKRKEILDDNT